jgi:hypothetical protein
MTDRGGFKKIVRTFPRARRAPSNKSMTPSIMKNTPNEVSPTPISVHRRIGRSVDELLSVKEREGFFY